MGILLFAQILRNLCCRLNSLNEFAMRSYPKITISLHWKYDAISVCPRLFSSLEELRLWTLPNLENPGRFFGVL